MVETSARERLLDCAEELFAAHGVEGVSLRAINAKAGLSPAALHYHFGSKQALLETLLERRMSVLMERRRALLDAIESSPEPPTTRDVIDALMAPLADLLAREGEAGRRYLRLICRLYGDSALDERVVRRRFQAGVERLEPMLQRALPDLPVSVVRLRLAFAIDAMMRGLAHWPKLASMWRADEFPIARDEFVSSLGDFLVGGLEARTNLTLTTTAAVAPEIGPGAVAPEHPHGDEA